MTPTTTLSAPQFILSLVDSAPQVELRAARLTDSLDMTVGNN